MGREYSADLSGLRDELISGLRELRKEVEQESKKVGQAIGDGYEDGYDESVEEVRKSKKELLQELDNAKKQFERSLGKLPDAWKKFTTTLGVKDLTRATRGLNNAFNQMANIRTQLSDIGESFDIDEWLDSMQRQVGMLFDANKAIEQQVSANQKLIDTHKQLLKEQKKSLDLYDKINKSKESVLGEKFGDPMRGFEESAEAVDVRLSEVISRMQEIESEAKDAKKVFDELNESIAAYSGKPNWKAKDYRDAIQGAWNSGKKDVAVSLYEDFQESFPKQTWRLNPVDMFGDDWANTFAQNLETANRQLTFLRNKLEATADAYGKFAALMALEDAKGSLTNRRDTLASEAKHMAESDQKSKERKKNTDALTEAVAVEQTTQSIADGAEDIDSAYDSATKKVSKLREQLAAAKNEQEELEKHARVYGYTIGMDAKRASRIQGILEKTGDNWTRSRADVIPSLLSKGEEVYKTNTGYEIAHPRMTTGISITKTEYDYALYLQKKIQELNTGWEEGLRILGQQNDQLLMARANVAYLEEQISEANTQTKKKTFEEIELWKFSATPGGQIAMFEGMSDPIDKAVESAEELRGVLQDVVKIPGQISFDEATLPTLTESEHKAVFDNKQIDEWLETNYNINAENRSKIITEFERVAQYSKQLFETNSTDMDAYIEQLYKIADMIIEYSRGEEASNEQLASFYNYFVRGKKGERARIRYNDDLVRGLGDAWIGTKDAPGIKDRLGVKYLINSKTQGIDTNGDWDELVDAAQGLLSAETDNSEDQFLQAANLLITAIDARKGGKNKDFKHRLPSRLSANNRDDIFDEADTFWNTNMTGVLLDAIETSNQVVDATESVGSAQDKLIDNLREAASASDEASVSAERHANSLQKSADKASDELPSTDGDDKDSYTPIKSLSADDKARAINLIRESEKKVGTEYFKGIEDEAALLTKLEDFTKKLAAQDDYEFKGLSVQGNKGIVDLTRTNNNIRESLHFVYELNNGMLELNESTVRYQATSVKTFDQVQSAMQKQVDDYAKKNPFEYLSVGLRAQWKEITESLKDAGSSEDLYKWQTEFFAFQDKADFEFNSERLQTEVARTSDLLSRTKSNLEKAFRDTKIDPTGKMSEEQQDIYDRYLRIKTAVEGYSQSVEHASRENIRRTRAEADALNELMTVYAQNMNKKVYTQDSVEVRDARAEVARLKASAGSLKIPGIAELDAALSQIVDDESLNKFKSLLGAVRKEVSAKKQEASNSTRTLNDANRMETVIRNATIEVDELRNHLNLLGDVKGVAEAEAALKRMTSAAVAFNKATDAEGQISAYNEYNKAKADYDAQYGLAQSEKRLVEAENREAKNAAQSYQNALVALNNLHKARKNLSALQIDDNAAGSSLQEAQRAVDELQTKYELSLNLLATEEDYNALLQRERTLQHELEMFADEQLDAKFKKQQAAELAETLSVERQTAKEITQYDQERAETQRQQIAHFNELVELQKKYNKADYGFYKADIDGTDKLPYVVQMEYYAQRMQELRKEMQLTADQQMELDRINNEHTNNKNKLMPKLDDVAVDRRLNLVQFDRWNANIKNVGTLSDETKQKIEDMRATLLSVQYKDQLDGWIEDFRQLQDAVTFETTGKPTKDRLAATKDSLESAKRDLDVLYKGLNLDLDLGDAAPDANTVKVAYDAATAAINRCTKAIGEQSQEEIAHAARSAEIAKERLSAYKAAQDVFEQSQQREEAFTGTGAIKNYYKQLNTIIQEINKLDTKIRSTALKDNGTGMLTHVIEDLEAQKQGFITKVNSIAEDISVAFNDSFIIENQVDLPFSHMLNSLDGVHSVSVIESFFSDTRVQAALTEPVIDKFIANLQNAQNKAEEFASIINAKFEDVQNSTLKLQMLGDAGYVSKDHVQYRSAQVRAASIAQFLAREDVSEDRSAWTARQTTEFLQLANAYNRYVSELEQGAVKEANYFASRKDAYTNIGTLSAFDGAVEQNMRMSESAMDSARQALEKYVTAFADSKAYITGFTTSADGISKINFSVMEEGTNQVRTFGAELGQFTDRVHVYETSMNGLTAGTKAADKAISSLSDMIRMLEQLDTSDFDETIKKLQQFYDDLNAQRKAAGASKDIGSQNSMKNTAADAQKAIKEAAKSKQQWDKMQADFESGISIDLGKINKSGDVYAQMLDKISTNAGEATISNVKFNGVTNTLTYTLTEASGAIKDMTANMNDLGVVTARVNNVGQRNAWWQDLGGSIGGVGKEIGRYAVNMLQVMDMIRYLRQGFNEVLEIDTALTELRKVTDETDATYNKFLQTMSKTGAVVGSTVKDLTTSAADWARLGYSLEEAGKLAENTMVLMNVSEFDNVTDATDTLVSALQAFKDQSVDAYTLSTRIIDVFNQIGNSYAISTSDLADSLTRSSASLVAANNTLEQSVALTTAANTTIQNPEVVGTTLKTLAMRIRGVKSELEEAGEDTDGMIVNTAKLQETVQALTNVDGSGGVNILANSNEFKSTYDILLEISRVWDKMNDVDQAALLEIIAGKRAGSAVASILSNGDILENAYKDALGADGSAQQELNTYLDSIQGKIDQFNNSTQTMWMNFMNSDVLKFFIELATGVVNVTDKIGLLNVAIAAFMAKTAFKSDSFMQIFSVDKAVAGVTNKLNTMAKEAGKAAASTALVGTASAAASFGVQLLNSAITMGISLLVGLLVSGVVNIFKAIANNSQEVAEELNNTQTELDKVNTELETTQKRIAELEGMGNLSIVEKTELEILKRTNDELERRQRLLRNRKGELIAEQNVNIRKEYEDEYVDSSSGYSGRNYARASAVESNVSSYSVSGNFDAASKYLLWQFDPELYKATIDKSFDELSDTMQDRYKEFNAYVQSLASDTKQKSLNVEQYIEDTAADYRNLNKMLGEELAKPVDQQDDAFTEYLIDQRDTAQSYLSERAADIIGYLDKYGEEDDAFTEKLQGELELIDKALNPSQYYSDQFKTILDEYKGLKSELYALASEGELTEDSLNGINFSGFLAELNALDSEVQWTAADIAAYMNNLTDIEVQSVVDPSFSIVDYSDVIDEVQENISAWQSALESLNDGSFTYADFIDLTQQFPDLAKGVDASSKEFKGLSQNLKKAIRSSPDQLIDDLEELRQQLADSGKSTVAIDNLITSLEGMPEDAIDGLIGKYGTLTDQIDSARIAQNKLKEAMSENPNEGFETRGEAIEQMKTLMKEGKIGSESELWSIAEEFGFTYDSAKTINENAQALHEFITTRESWYKTDKDGNYQFEGIESFIKYVAGKKDILEQFGATWTYNNGAFEFDLDNEQWEEFAAALGMTSEEFSDLMIQIGQFYGINWQDADDVSSYISNIADGSGTASEKIDMMTDAVESYVEKAFGKDLDFENLTEASIDALECDDSIKNLLKTYLKLKEEFDDPLDIESTLTEDGLEGLTKIKELQNVITQNSDGTTIVNEDAFREVLSNAGYTEEQINSLITKIKEYQQLASQPPSDPLGITDTNASIDTVSTKLDELGIKHLILKDQLGQPVSLNVNANDLITTLAEKGWTSEQIQQYINDLTSTDNNIDFTIDGEVNAEAINTAIEQATSGTKIVNATIDYILGTQANPEDKDAMVNYVLGTQVNPETADALVNYLLGTQADPTLKETLVNYLLGTQVDPDDANALVNYLLGDQADPATKDTLVNYLLGTQTSPEAASALVNYLLGDQADPALKNAVVNYLLGTQAKPETSEALVNYLLGDQADPALGEAFVNYLLGKQADANDMSALVNYLRGTQEPPETQYVDIIYNTNTETLSGPVVPSETLYNNTPTFGEQYGSTISWLEELLNRTNEAISHADTDAAGDYVANLSAAADNLAGIDGEDLTSTAQLIVDALNLLSSGELSEEDAASLASIVTGITTALSTLSQDGTLTQGIGDSLMSGIASSLTSAGFETTAATVAADINTALSTALSTGAYPVTVMPSLDESGVSIVEAYTFTDKDLEIISNASSELIKLNNIDNKIISDKSYTVTRTEKIVGGGGGHYSPANGTAHAVGTAFSNGSWGAPKGDKQALVGELGPEILVRDGRWQTIGENGAEFREIKKGDIIFNHKQSRDLLKNGYVTGRGKAYAEGTAYASGGGTFKKYSFSDTTGSSASKLSKAAQDISKASDKLSDDFKEIFDWIEVRIEEITEHIDLNNAKLENTIGSINQNVVIDEMIDLNQKLYNNLTAGASQYYEYAKQLLAKVPAEYRAAAEDGAIAIESFTGKVGESTLEAIESYREWVQKGADLTQQAHEVLTEISNLAKQAIDNIAADYENKVSTQDNKMSQYEAYNSLLETDIGFESAQIYQAMIDETNANIATIQEQRDKMQAELNKHVESGNIVKYSQDWYDAVNAIAELDTEIIELTTDTEDFQDAINELHWEHFDLLVSQLEAVSNEAETLIDILGNKDLVDEDGNWTAEGITSLGLYAQQMEAAEVQAREYQEQIEYLNANWKKLGYTEQEYLEKLDELKSGQYDAIQAYHDTKDAIVDLNSERVDAIKEGIEKEIDAYEKLIDAKKRELDAEKDLYDFQKNIMKQEKDIADIQRQLAALAGDNSASARAKRAQLEAELVEAQADLEDSYYERSIANQQETLDNELKNFQDTKDQEMEALDEYLENTELVISDSLATIQANTDVVYQTLTQLGNEYSLSIAESLTSPWQAGEAAIQSYSEQFGIYMSETVSELEALEDYFSDSMLAIEQSGANAVDAVHQNATGYQEAIYQEPPKVDPPSQEEPTVTEDPNTIKVGDLINAKGAKIYGWEKDKTAEYQYFKNDPIYIVLGESNGRYKVRWHKAPSGVTGWFNKGDVKKYAAGTTGVKNDQFALIDELGEELVLHAQNGKLAFMTKGSAVVPHDITENLMELGQLDPSAILERNKPQIGLPAEIHNTEINLNIQYGDMVSIGEFHGDNPDDIAKIVAKQFEKHTKDLNAALRKYTR